MIVNCGTIRLDWERASLSAYQEALEAWNERDGKDKPSATPPSDDLKKFRKAHGI